MKRNSITALTFWVFAFAGWSTAIVSVITNIQMKTELATWVKLAGKSQAIADYRNGTIHFLSNELSQTNGALQVPITNSGIPFVAFPDHGESTRSFVKFYNQQMEQMLGNNNR